MITKNILLLLFISLLSLINISKEKKLLSKLKNQKSLNRDETPEQTLEKLNNNLNDLSKAQITLNNLLTKKQLSAQSIVENVSNEVGADVQEEQEKLKKKVEEILKGTYHDDSSFNSEKNKENDNENKEKKNKNKDNDLKKNNKKEKENELENEIENEIDNVIDNVIENEKDYYLENEKLRPRQPSEPGADQDPYQRGLRSC